MVPISQLMKEIVTSISIHERNQSSVTSILLFRLTAIIIRLLQKWSPSCIKVQLLLRLYPLMEKRQKINSTPLILQTRQCERAKGLPVANICQVVVYAHRAQPRGRCSFLGSLRTHPISIYPRPALLSRH